MNNAPHPNRQVGERWWDRLSHRDYLANFYVTLICDLNFEYPRCDTLSVVASPVWDGNGFTRHERSVVLGGIMGLITLTTMAATNHSST